MGTPLILCNFVVLIYAMSKNQEEGNKFNLNDRKPVGKDRGNNSPENNSEARGSENHRRDDSGRRDSGFSRNGGNGEKREGFGGDRRGGSGDRDRRPGGFGGDRDRRPGGFGGDRERKPGGFGGDRDRREGSGDRAYSKDFKKIKGKTFDTKNPYADSDSSGSNERSKPKKVKRERIESKSVKAGFGYKGANRDLQKHGEGLQKGSRLLQEEIRLNRYISNSGLCSRREADALIAQGLVQVNGNAVTELGSKVGPKDVVKVEGRRIMPEKPVYILLNKPKGYITTTDDPDGRKTVMDLIDLPGKERIYPVGRLDRNTTGVLMLTNDGEFAQKMTHPSFEIKKIYRAKLDRKPSKESMLAWVEGIDLEDGFMNFEQVGFVDENDPTILGVEIHSGRNRIVRRMFEHFKYEVEALDRVLIGEFDKLKLGRGKWRFLSDKEVAYVERLKRQKPKKIEPKKVIDPDKMDFSFGSMDFSEE
jgi:23S rRNA pseudouridine2605 synthase